MSFFRRLFKGSERVEFRPSSGFVLNRFGRASVDKYLTWVQGQDARRARRLTIVAATRIDSRPTIPPPPPKRVL